MKNEITICLTSCGRFDLLGRTIKSLVQNWDGEKPKEFLIYEDSDLDDPSLLINLNWLEELVPRNFCHSNIILGLMGKAGQINAIDGLYSEVQTPYIFHCEDDWEFTRTGFIQPSLDILENNPNICQVWIRKPNDRNGHPATGQVVSTPSGTKYQLMKTGFRGVWNGFSFNPGLRRLSDYQKIGPYSAYMKSNSLDTEAEISKAYLRHGFRAATLLDGYCKHIGAGRHVN